MRYMSLDNVVFANSKGVSTTIKDLREYPSYVKLLSQKVNASDMIDEIASRKDIYGEGGEMNCYKIVDMNIVKLYEANFELTTVKSLDIPDNQ